MCVEESKANGRRELTWFRLPNTGGLSPAMSNRHRCCCCCCCCCCSATRTRPPCAVVDTREGKVTGTPFVPASTSKTSGVGACIGAGEDELPPAAGSSLLATNSFWEVAPLLMSARYLGIPSVPRVYVWCVFCVRGYVEPRLQGMTSQCGATGLMSYRSYRSIDVVPNLPKCRVPV